MQFHPFVVIACIVLVGGLLLERSGRQASTGSCDHVGYFESVRRAHHFPTLDELKTIRAKEMESRKQRGRDEFANVVREAAKRGERYAYMGPRWLMNGNELRAAGYTVTTDDRGNWKIRFLPYSLEERELSGRNTREYANNRRFWCGDEMYPTGNLDGEAWSAWCAKQTLDDLEHEAYMHTVISNETIAP